MRPRAPVQPQTVLKAFSPASGMGFAAVRRPAPLSASHGCHAKSGAAGREVQRLYKMLCIFMNLLGGEGVIRTLQEFCHV